MGYSESEVYRRVWHPRDAAEACSLKKRFGDDGVYVSGSTLLRTQWESGLANMPFHLIDLGTVRELNGMTQNEQELMIGAMTTLAACRRDGAVTRYFPMLTEAVRSIAAPSIRNLATLGGNIVSTTGDSLPVLLVYGAQLLWQDGQVIRGQSAENWLEEVRQQGRDADRVLTRIRLPLEAAAVTLEGGDEGEVFYAYHKVGRREAFIPSIVTTALIGRIDSQGLLQQMRIAVGGGQTVPYRLKAVEAMLNGRRPDQALLTEMHAAVAMQFEPAPDIFVPVEYRKKTAANLIATDIWKALERLSAKKG